MEWSLSWFNMFAEFPETCDYFTVLRDGKYIEEGKIADTAVDEIFYMMVGKNLLGFDSY